MLCRLFLKSLLTKEKLTKLSFTEYQIYKRHSNRNSSLYPLNNPPKLIYSYFMGEETQLQQTLISLRLHSW